MARISSWYNLNPSICWRRMCNGLKLKTWRKTVVHPAEAPGHEQAFTNKSIYDESQYSPCTLKDFSNQVKAAEDFDHMLEFGFPEVQVFTGHTRYKKTIKFSLTPVLISDK